MKLLTLVAALAPFFASHLHASEPTIVTDRPDAAESSQDVGLGVFQIETSLQFALDDDSGSDVHTASFPTLLRYGILDWLEMRLEGDLFTIQTPDGGPSVSGFADVAFGAKAHLRQQDGATPSTGLMVNINAPIGDREFTSNAAEPQVKLLTDWDLPRGFSLALNNGLDLPARDSANERFVRYLYALALGTELAFICDALGAYLEITGAVPIKKSKPKEHQLDAGLTYLLTPNSQLDLFVQFGLNGSEDDVTTGVGFSFRLPKAS